MAKSPSIDASDATNDPNPNSLLDYPNRLVAIVDNIVVLVTNTNDEIRDIYLKQPTFVEVNGDSVIKPGDSYINGEFFIKPQSPIA